VRSQRNLADRIPEIVGPSHTDRVLTEVGATLNDESPFPPDIQDPVAVPHTELSADALRGVVESFVLREGTDYGEKDFSLEQKVAHVIRQLERGEARVMFDPNSESIDIISLTPMRRARDQD
jgi:uncharacterized protein YheU (UPF0270 family)